MPRELVTIQIGQCGNQIGYKFWELVLQEHVAQHKTQKQPLYDEAISTFFRNVDTRYADHPTIPYDAKQPQPIVGLKARAVLVDMEEGVLNQLQKDAHMGELFDAAHVISDVSGAGNNW